MNRILFRLGLVGLVWTAFLSGGCTELFLIFGPGAAFGPQTGSGTAGGGLSATTQNVTIASPLFSAVQLDPILEATAGAKVIVSVDLDADGLIDFVSGSDESQPIQFHRRTSPTAVAFDTFTIAGGAPISRMIDLEVADLDGDGRLDVAVLIKDTGFVPVTGANIRGAVVLLFAPVDRTNGLAWVAVTIDDTFTRPGDDPGMTSFAVADVDGINGPDIILGSNEIMDTKNILLYRNPGGAAARTGANWAVSTITFDAVEVEAIESTDMDGDGDPDVVAAFPTAKSLNVRWLQNPRVESGAASVVNFWTRRIVGQQQDGGDVLSLGDIDGDGDNDVAVASVSDALVQWFENPGIGIVQQQNFPWRVFNIGTLQAGVSINQVQLVDLNLDGQLDAFVTASGNVVGFQPGSDIQAVWQAFSIVGTNPVATVGRTAFNDVDGNGLLDIILPLDRDGLILDNFLILLRLTP